MNIMRNKKHPKCIKKMQELVDLHLGENMRLNEILEMADLGLVGHFLGRRMNNDSLKEWTKANFDTWKLPSNFNFGKRLDGPDIHG